MNKSGADQTLVRRSLGEGGKEQTKIRRKLNRIRRRKIRQILKSSSDDTKIPIFKNTSGWLTWQKLKVSYESNVFR